VKILICACAALAFGLLLALWRLDRVGTKLDVANEQVTTLNKAADSRRNTQKLLAQLDTEHTKALTDAQAANSKLRDDVRNGARRLSVKATCPAVRDTATSTGLGHAEARAELDPAAAERIVAITDDGDKGLIALQAAQAYITNVCLKGDN
jgi:prophage endopeptidase